MQNKAKQHHKLVNLGLKHIEIEANLRMSIYEFQNLNYCMSTINDKTQNKIIRYEQILNVLPQIIQEK